MLSAFLSPLSLILPKSRKHEQEEGAESKEEIFYENKTLLWVRCMLSVFSLHQLVYVEGSCMLCMLFFHLHCHVMLLLWDNHARRRWIRRRKSSFSVLIDIIFLHSFIAQYIDTSDCVFLMCMKGKAHLVSLAATSERIETRSIVVLCTNSSGGERWALSSRRRSVLYSEQPRCIRAGCACDLLTHFQGGKKRQSLCSLCWSTFCADSSTIYNFSHSSCLTLCTLHNVTMTTWLASSHSHRLVCSVFHSRYKFIFDISSSSGWKFGSWKFSLLLLSFFFTRFANSLLFHLFYLIFIFFIVKVSSTTETK